MAKKRIADEGSTEAQRTYLEDLTEDEFEVSYERMMWAHGCEAADDDGDDWSPEGDAI